MIPIRRQLGQSPTAAEFSAASDPLVMAHRDAATETDPRLRLECVLREHQGPIYGYLRTRLIQHADAEDLTQEVFMRWYAGREKFDRSRDLRPWLIAIARNVLREYIKKIETRREVTWTELCLRMEQLMEFDDQDSRYHEFAPHLPGCLSALGPSAREALELKYRMRLRLVQIGQKLHRSEGAVKLLMLRARQALRQCLTARIDAQRAGGPPRD